jgi:hypothetical protein
VGAGGQDTPAPLVRQDPAQGQPPRDPLGEGNCVGQDAVLLEGKQRPRAPYAVCTSSTSSSQSRSAHSTATEWTKSFGTGAPRPRPVQAPA